MVMEKQLFGAYHAALVVAMQVGASQFLIWYSGIQKYLKGELTSKGKICIVILRLVKLLWFRGTLSPGKHSSVCGC